MVSMAISKQTVISSLVLTASVVLMFFGVLSFIHDHEDDRIAHGLPDQPRVSFTQRSGYINVDENVQRFLFYYLVEAVFDPRSKPLVIWLTGGPGCSSVGVGAFTEHGPFRPNGEALVPNKYSWNTEANMLYLESPAGVGFSYSSNKSFYANITDEMTARDNLNFLEKWVAKHPKYKNRDLFIAGESYGGHFVPQLANLVLNSSLKSCLKGILVGNPLLDFSTDFNKRANYLKGKELISYSTLNMSRTLCNFSRLLMEFMGPGNVTPPCLMVNNQLDYELSDYVDLYDISVVRCNSLFTGRSLHPLIGVDYCSTTNSNDYLNRVDVQKALHARVGEWSLCNMVDQYYDMQELMVTSLPSIATLVKSGIRVMIYSGDQDAILPLTGTRILIARLAKGLGLNETQHWTCWLHLHGGHTDIGGWTEEYSPLLSFATIQGAGHMAPYKQPKKALVLFQRFIRGRSLVASKRKQP